MLGSVKSQLCRVESSGAVLQCVGVGHVEAVCSVSGVGHVEAGVGGWHWGLGR